MQKRINKKKKKKNNKEEDQQIPKHNVTTVGTSLTPYGEKEYIILGAKDHRNKAM